MEQLKLPKFDIRIRDQEVFCLVRKKWIVLTPEEWVRQHFLNLLIQHLNYPKGLIRLEHSHSYFKNKKRSDIVVLDRNSGIFLVVECKATNVTIESKVLNQVSEYNKVLNSKYIAITNGINNFIWEKRDEKYNQLTSFPRYTESYVE